MHVYQNRSHFSDFKESVEKVRVGKDKLIYSYVVEAVLIILMVNEMKHTIDSVDVIYTPGMLQTLLSTAKVWKNGFQLLWQTS